MNELLAQQDPDLGKVGRRQLTQKQLWTAADQVRPKFEQVCTEFLRQCTTTSRQPDEDGKFDVVSFVDSNGAERVAMLSETEPARYLSLAPKKALVRAAEKVEQDYDGDWRRLNDVVRCSMVASTEGELVDICKSLMAHDVRHIRTKESGYAELKPDNKRWAQPTTLSSFVPTTHQPYTPSPVPSLLVLHTAPPHLLFTTCLGLPPWFRG